MDFESFCGTVAHACAEVEGTPNVLFAVDDGDSALVGTADIDEATSFLAQLDQLIKNRTMAALATRVDWSPDESATRPSWFLTAVAVERNAFFAVRRDQEDERWWTLPPDQAPWFGLATAGGIRAALEKGEPMRIKSIQDDRLLKRPTDEPNPPQDKHGLL